MWFVCSSPEFSVFQLISSKTKQNNKKYTIRPLGHNQNCNCAIISKFNFCEIIIIIVKLAMFQIFFEWNRFYCAQQLISECQIKSARNAKASNLKKITCIQLHLVQMSSKRCIWLWIEMIKLKKANGNDNFRLSQSEINLIIELQKTRESTHCTFVHGMNLFWMLEFLKFDIFTENKIEEPRNQCLREILFFWLSKRRTNSHVTLFVDV